MKTNRDTKIKAVKYKKDVKEFINVPFTLYDKSSNWVPQLISDQLKLFNPAKNPYYSHSDVQLFIAYKDGKAVGRITAHTNKQHNLFYDDNVGFFGFFECIDDDEVAKALLDRAAEWLKARNCDVIRGPFSFSTNDECGLLVDGFDTQPYVMMIHNHQYYEKLIINSGLNQCKEMYAYLLKDDKVPERLERLAAVIQKKQNVEVRTLAKNKKGLRKDIETVFTLYQKAWERNWGFVPMTSKEFDHLVETLLPIVDPDLVLIASIDGVPVGFSVALPDYNIILRKLWGKVLPFGLFKLLYYKNKIHRLRVIVMGIVKEYQKRGIDGLFYYHTFKNGLQKGFYEAEFSWVLEDNYEMRNVAVKLGAIIHKTYRIYERKIQ